MTIDVLIPVEDCWVQRRGNKEPLGQVVDRKVGSLKVKVTWWTPNRSWQEWLDIGDLESGFQRGWAVQDVPISATRKPLGRGTIIGQRKLAQRDQCLVQFDEDGSSVWLPYENLRRIKTVKMRYERTETSVEDHAERFRLRLLAHALENWNHLTGSLDRLDVDPLPHQIQLVHRILSSGNYNWLIADDVGLGKTIEVGLLLAALKRKGQARRVLVVSPAGLTRQWQDELKHKFDQEFMIYGRDFSIHDHEHWKRYDHVIASIDLAKRENHMEVFRQAGGWDIVVFDEGHKLTRHASGERADRYKLAEMLRPMSDGFFLLSGTPHQGYVDRFISILELVRPDLRRQIHTLRFNPEIVSDLILRNRKSEVTDADGQFIFKGQDIHRIPVRPSRETLKFQKLLDEYLRHGYRSGEKGGSTGRAIGFVMTTYRKLASSSIAAIERSLQLRLEKLSGELNEYKEDGLERELTLDDLSEGGDDQDDLAMSISSTGAKEFFAHEGEMIEGLLEAAKAVYQNDEKLQMFLNEVVAPLVEKGEKLLVFTEYRGTQIYLKEALEDQFPEVGEIELLNGSMGLDEKLEAISAFNESAQFMVSTEAGGEGINLHESCYVMVNYDLPWNPSRLVQRIGRLYRYGQKKKVVVFNLHARDSFDNSAIDLMLQRITNIVQDMAPVGEEYNERLDAEILGEILENMDLSSILRSATDMNIKRTQEDIDKALKRAQEAKKLQDEVFTYVAGYDPNALGGTIGFTMQHVDLFIRKVLPITDIDLQATLYDGEVLEIRLPKDMQGKFPEFGRRTVVRVTTNRRLAHRLQNNVVLLDFETKFFQHLIELAQSQPFDGLYASVVSTVGERGVLAAFKLRWQNDQGKALTEEFVPLFATTKGKVSENPPFLAEWLMSQVTSAPVPSFDRKSRHEAYNGLVEVADSILASKSTRFKHPNGRVDLAAADCRPQESRLD
ncbi:MAG: SNF2-related protein [Gemmatimonadota bacterium]|nr:SNF2-related protein [Gemmatimonadota bacterium]